MVTPILVMFALYLRIDQTLPQACAKCSNLNPQTGQIVFTSTPVNTYDISWYTCDQIKYLTAFGGQGDLQCSDTANTITFTMSPTGAMRVLLGGGAAVLDGSCCGAGNPYNVCNAPDQQTDVDELCRNLGYTSAVMTINTASNTCPEVHFASEIWTSDFVSSSGSITAFTCSGCTATDRPQACQPTAPPTPAPTDNPTKNPTKNPTPAPTSNPTPAPTDNPTKYPTKYPTKNPTPAPTENPTLAPTLAPTTPPSLAPSVAPSVAPSRSPSIAPTLAPSLAPSLAPTTPPSAAPSIAPSIAPSLAPSIAPSIAPTQPPSLAPTLAPSIAPSIAPSLAPSLNPSLAPSVAPSVAPSLAPTTPPTLAPSIAPSLAPSIAPSIAPSLAPSVAPSLAPSFSPTLAPSLAPSMAPTSSPTPTCHYAQFKREMIVSDTLNRNDILWGGDSFVSQNCRFLLTLTKTGNLILIGLVGKYLNPFEKDDFGRYIYNNPFAEQLNYDRWYNGWDTNTHIANHSGVSVPRLVLKENSVIVEEQQYKNSPGFEAITLWKSVNESNHTIEDTANELILRLTDDKGCLVLNAYGAQMSLDTALWYICPTYTPPIPDTTEQTQETTKINTISSTLITNTMDQDTIELNSNMNNSFSLWIWILIIALSVLVVLSSIFYWYKRRRMNFESDSIPISSLANTSISQSINDEEMERQLEQWGQETTTPNTTVNVTTFFGEVACNVNDVNASTNIEIETIKE